MTPLRGLAILSPMSVAALSVPPILDSHREPPDFDSMTEDECRAYCRAVWAQYVRPGRAIDPRERPEVLAVLAAHVPPPRS